MCFDENYAIGAGVLLTSIIANNAHLNFHFHLFSLSLNDSDKEKFKKLDNKKINITLYLVNILLTKNQTDRFPFAAHIRLIVPNLFYECIDRLLYLDSDMLCTGKLDKLLNTDISSYIAACVLDVDSLREQLSKNINLPDSNYFNSGMLYINTKRWYEEQVSEKTSALLNKQFYQYPDQDVLNICLNKKYLIIKNIFNYLTEIIISTRLNYFKKTNHDEAILFHFVGDRKPWYKLHMNALYKHYLDRSPWKNKKLKCALENDYSVIRIYSEELFKQNRYLDGLKYFIIYLLSKYRIIRRSRHK